MIDPDDHQLGPSKNVVSSTSTLEPFPDKNKAKEIRFDKSLQKWIVEDLSTPLKFDIVAQLANIPIHITMRELLCLQGN